MKRLARLTSRAGARLYPYTWRKRYGEEFDALLEDATSDWRTPVDILKGALAMQMRTWNFGKMVVAAGVCGALVALAASFAMPGQYRLQSVLKTTAPAATGDVFRLAQEVTSRSLLIAIMDTFGLYKSARARTPLLDVIDLMRKRLVIAPITSAGNGDVAAFAVRFDYDDPIEAQRVTQALACKAPCVTGKPGPATPAT